MKVGTMLDDVIFDFVAVSRRIGGEDVRERLRDKNYELYVQADMLAKEFLELEDRLLKQVEDALDRSINERKYRIEEMTKLEEIRGVIQKHLNSIWKEQDLQKTETALERILDYIDGIS